MTFTQAGFTGTLFALAISWAHAMQPAAATVWDGVYSVEQATRGKQSYTNDCSGCHMDDLSGGGPAPALGGDAFLAQNEKRSVADLFTRIRTTMPPDRPEGLDDEDYLAIVAYLLQEAGFPAGSTALPAQLDVLKQIQIVSKKTGTERGTE